MNDEFAPINFPCRQCGAKKGHPCLDYRTEEPAKTEHKIRKIFAREAEDRDARLRKAKIR